MDRRIVLIGPPGAGKTTCGQSLANKLGWNFFDTDTVIESKVGCSVSEFFSSKGEFAFRELETQTLEEVLADHSSGSVIGTGGGIILSSINRSLLLQVANLCYLEATVETLLERLEGDTSRPLLQSGQSSGDTICQNSNAALRKRLTSLLSERANLYAIAPHTVKTANLDPEEVAQKIVEHLNLVSEVR